MSYPKKLLQISLKMKRSKTGNDFGHMINMELFSRYNTDQYIHTFLVAFTRVVGVCEEGVSIL